MLKRLREHATKAGAEVIRETSDKAREKSGKEEERCGGLLI
jgi:hypothetical protein